MIKILVYFIFFVFSYQTVFSCEDDPFQDSQGMHPYDYAMMKYKKPHLIPNEWRNPLLKACERELDSLSTILRPSRERDFFNMLGAMKILVMDQILSRGDSSKGEKVIKELDDYFSLQLRRWEMRVAFLKNHDSGADELSEPSLLLCYSKEEVCVDMSSYSRWKTFLMDCLEIPRTLSESYYRVFKEKYSNSVNPTDNNKFISGMDPYEYRILSLRHTSEVQEKTIQFFDKHSKLLFILIDYLHKPEQHLNYPKMDNLMEILESGMKNLRAVFEAFNEKIHATELERAKYLEEQEIKKQQSFEEKIDLSDSSSASSKEKTRNVMGGKPKVKLQVKPSVLNLAGLGAVRDAKKNMRRNSPRPSKGKNCIKRSPKSDGSIELAMSSTSEHSSSSSSNKLNRGGIVSSLRKIGQSAQDLKRSFSEQISPRKHFSGSAETDDSSISFDHTVMGEDEEEGYSAGSEESEDDQIHEDKKPQYN